MKNVKKLLTQHKSEILPDDKIKDNIKQKLGMNEKQSSLAYAHGGEKSVSVRRNNTLMVVCAAVFAAILVLGVFVSIIIKKHGGGDLPPFGNKFEQITDADSFYAYGAASVGTLLSSSSKMSSNGGANAVSDQTSTLLPQYAAINPDSEQLATINRYMMLVESLLSDGKIESKTIIGEMGYECGMSVNYTDLRGESIEYKMFFNKVFLTGKNDGKETKENYSINGILVLGNEQYPVEGLYKKETETDESESKLYFKAFTSADKKSYIEVEQKIETESNSTEVEQEFVYSIYDNGKLKELTRIKYEVEDDELELKMSITNDGKTETLTFSDETGNDERVINVRGNIDGQSVKFKIYVRQNNYHYVFEDGSSSDLDRDDDDDDDDDSDDSNNGNDGNDDDEKDDENNDDPDDDDD